MSEKKKYTPEEIEALAEQAAQNAMNHFKHGLTCAECVFKGFLDLGLTDFPPEIVALSSGYGGGSGYGGYSSYGQNTWSQGGYWQNQGSYSGDYAQVCTVNL